MCPAAAAEGSRQKSKSAQQRRRMPKAARDHHPAVPGASGAGLSAESSSASMPADSSAAQQRRAPPGQCTANSSQYNMLSDDLWLAAHLRSALLCQKPKGNFDHLLSTLYPCDMHGLPVMQLDTLHHSQ